MAALAVIAIIYIYFELRKLKMSATLAEAIAGLTADVDALAGRIAQLVTPPPPPAVPPEQLAALDALGVRISQLAPVATP